MEGMATYSKDARGEWLWLKIVGNGQGQREVQYNIIRCAFPCLKSLLL